MSKGYIQIELGGKLRGLKFDQGAIHEMQEKAKGSENPAFVGYALIWGGLVSNCYRKGEELDITFDQMCDLVDLVPQEKIAEITAEFNKLFDFETEPAEETKKKTRRKNTKQNVST